MIDSCDWHALSEVVVEVLQTSFRELYVGTSGDVQLTLI